ncbi:MAG: hypothetical protein Q8P48_05275 [Deltaproteobacteria bacterium]|nr:hypothetical protein [Deltaproteobacteria bacterium]
MSLKEYSRNYLLVAASLALLVFTGCSGEKKAPQTPQQEAAAPASAPAGAEQAMPDGHPAVEKGLSEMAQVSHANLKTQKEIKLSPEVKKKWKEAKLEVTDAASKQTRTVSIKVGSAVQLNDAGLKLKLDVIVPDYAISDNRIESRSNDAKNPAVLVDLLEGDKSVARGWVFRDFPEFNSYTDGRFPLVLVETGTGN